MSSLQDSIPFQRGSTYANGDSTILDSTYATVNGKAGEQHVGRVVYFTANTDSALLSYTSIGADQTGRLVKAIVVRNNSASTLKPGYLAHFDVTTSGVKYGTAIDGYCESVADKPAGIIDDYLTNGVPAGDLCYLIVDGPTRGVNTDSTQTAWAIGDRLVPATAGSTRVDAVGGRLVKQDVTGSAATLGNNVQNVVGYGDSTVAGGSVATVGTVLIPIVVKCG